MKNRIFLLSLFTFLTLGIFSSCRTNPQGSSGTSTPRYTEKYRPRFHFSPDSMWMNDPNGMVFYEGEYHLFYQHHPYSTVWGPMHWGHAVSEDLVHWEHLPVALYPDSLGMIFSGSAVIDWKNSSGLGSSRRPPMVAIFTQHNQAHAEQGSDRFQYQSIAYSLDKGRSWTKYEGNPVLNNPGIRDFRDPKVFWMEETQQWIMVLAAQDRVMFFASPDLIHWTLESEFGEDAGAHGGVWECPDLFPLEAGGEQLWILLVSINPGGPNGGSATQYFVGQFDGHRFRSENPGNDPRWVDWGKDNYAGVTWSDIPASDGRRIFLGWMSNWQYANQVPTKRWRSAMTLPRELSLVQEASGYRLRSVPVAEVHTLRADHIRLEPPLQERQDIGPDPGDQPALFEIDLTFTYEPVESESADSAVEFGIYLKSKMHEILVMAFNTYSKQVFIGRMPNSGQSGFSDDFAGMHVAPYHISGEGEIRFHAFVDLASVELFIDDGALVMTEICFPGSGFQTVSMYRNHVSVNLKEGNIYRLTGIW